MDHKIKSYEAHVTIEPVFGDDFLKFEACCTAHGFKPAELLLQKTRQSTPERSNKDSFCTGHEDSFEGLQRRLMALVDCLESSGLRVWRYKIEGILIDVRKERLFTITVKESK